MSARNIARKSTGTRSSTSSSNVNTQGRSANLNNLSTNFSTRTRRTSSSDIDTPTRRLSSRNQSSQNSIQSTPGPSGASYQASNSRNISSDSEHEVSTQILPPRRRQFSRIQRAESSSDTTSDSDQNDHRDVSTTNSNRFKSRKLNSQSNPAANKKKSKKAKKDESFSEEEPSQSVSTVNKSATFSKQNISSLVNKCVYYLIIADQKKYSIKKRDILKHVFCPQNRKLYPEVLKEAGQVLKKTYGMELLSHEEKKGEYLMINLLNHDLGIQEFSDYSPSELQKRGLIFYLLTVIFMNEKSISEEELGAALEPLGINMNSKVPHPVFGDVYKYLTSELVKQMYLERREISKNLYEFSWGVRANQEFDKKDLLEFACQIINDTKPKDWILQYRDANGSSRRAEE